MVRRHDKAAQSEAAGRGLDNVEDKLGYRFRNPVLLDRALTHSSADEDSYERLEFLGDAVIQLVISDLLFHEYADMDEGSLTVSRMALVNNDSALSSISSDLGLLRYARLGKSFQRSNESAMRHLCADLVESVVGAVYVDGGLAEAKRIVLTHFQPLLELLKTEAPADSKSRLQQLLQARGLPLPTYTVVDVSGEAHLPEFVVECAVEGLERPSVGRGASVKIAQQLAAAAIIDSVHAIGKDEKP